MPVEMPFLSYQEAIQLVTYSTASPKDARVSLGTIENMIANNDLQAVSGSRYKLGQLKTTPQQFRFPVAFTFNAIGSTTFYVDMTKEKIFKASDFFPQEE